MHSPAFLYDSKRTDKEKLEFARITYSDIEATIKFLYKRGMWSKYHYNQWMKALQSMKNNEEILHTWWDAIVSGAMFEIDSMLEERLEAMRDFEEDQVEKEKMLQRQKRNISKKIM